MPKKILDGIVVSDKGNKSITVLLKENINILCYKKLLKLKKNTIAHDENNKFKLVIKFQ